MKRADSTFHCAGYQKGGEQAVFHRMYVYMQERATAPAAHTRIPSPSSPSSPSSPASSFAQDLLPKLSAFQPRTEVLQPCLISSRHLRPSSPDVRKLTLHAQQLLVVNRRRDGCCALVPGPRARRTDLRARLRRNRAGAGLRARPPRTPTHAPAPTRRKPWARALPTTPSLALLDGLEREVAGAAREVHARAAREARVEVHARERCLWVFMLNPARG